MQTRELHSQEIKKEVAAAAQRLRGLVLQTPCPADLFLSQSGRCTVFLKHENYQLSGSFKLRGAFNRLLTLTPDEKHRGIVTASTGNHGAAVAYGLKKLGMQGTIYVPETISPAKLETLRLYGADLVFHGKDTVVTETFARQEAASKGRVFISPYNDPHIVAGQGTVAAEIADELQHIDSVLVPVGGGGLIAGVAGYLKALDPGIEIIGCQPEQSPVMAESVKAGRIVEMESGPTLADGTAGGIEPGAMTFPVCRDCVDRFVLVSEEEIENALMLVLQKLNMLIEGAAALSVAAFLKEQDRFAGKRVVLILSGKRMAYPTLRRLICQTRS